MPADAGVARPPRRTSGRRAVGRPRSAAGAERVDQVVRDVDAVQRRPQRRPRPSASPAATSTSAAHGCVAQPAGGAGQAADAVTGGEQLGHEPAADVAGGAGDEDSRIAPESARPVQPRHTRRRRVIRSRVSRERRRGWGRRSRGAGGGLTAAAVDGRLGALAACRLGPDGEIPGRRTPSSSSRSAIRCRSARATRHCSAGRTLTVIRSTTLSTSICSTPSTFGSSRIASANSASATIPSAIVCIAVDRRVHVRAVRDGHVDGRPARSPGCGCRPAGSRRCGRTRACRWRRGAG